MIRTIFLGSPAFAVPSLEALIADNDIDVSLVVTQPDRKAGRGRRLQAPAVKIIAETHDIPVFQPESLRAQESVDRLVEIQPDVMIVVSYGEILRRPILELPAHGCLNVHPSLLPSYRGSTPIPATILNGDTETGVSIMRLVRQMDAGPLIAQTRVSLTGTETTGELTEHLAEVAARELPAIVRRWVGGEISEEPQDDSRATYTRQLRKSDAQIDWNRPAVEIERFVRAMDPWPGAWTLMSDQRIAVRGVTVEEPSEGHASDRPGSVTIDRDSIRVSTGSGAIRLDSVQPSGKKAMSGVDWARGSRLDQGARFDSPAEPLEPIIFTR